MVLPFNMDLDGLNLNYATAQPFCRLASNEPVYVFFAPEGINPEYAFNKSEIKSHVENDIVAIESGNQYIFKASKPGTDCTLKLTMANGKVVKIITLTNTQALNAWKAEIFGAERLFISNQELIFFKDQIRLQSTGTSEVKLSVYPALSRLTYSIGKATPRTDGVFSSLTIKIPTKNLKVDFKEIKDIKNFINTATALPLDDRSTTTTSASSPGPQYQTNLTSLNGSKYYEIKVPSTLKDLSDAYLTLNYKGDTGSAYVDGKLIADDFFSGLPMQIGLKRFNTLLQSGKILFQIIPLTDERQIYFEKGIREPLGGRKVAELNSAELIPQYEIYFTAGKI
jgi:hypothetical protein